MSESAPVLLEERPVPGGELKDSWHLSLQCEAGMKKAECVLFFLLPLFLLMFGSMVTNTVDAATFLSSGVGIISPTNSTYSPGALTLKTMVIGLGGSNIFYLMTYSLDGKDNVTIPLEIQIHERSFQMTMTGSTILPELSEGPHNITVYEKIEMHTSPPSTLLDMSSVYFSIDDGNPPIIANLSPENKTYSQKDLSLNFTTDESISWIGYCLNGQNNVTVSGNTTLTNLAYRDHNVTIYAQDLAGNIGTSETMYYTNQSIFQLHRLQLVLEWQ